MSAAEVVEQFDLAVVSGALASLIRAGRADRARRRALVGFAARSIAAHLGHAPYYDIDGKPEDGDCSSSPTHGGLAKADLLRSTLALMAVSDEPLARGLFRSVLRPIAEWLGDQDDSPEFAARASTGQMGVAASPPANGIGALRLGLAELASGSGPHPAAIEAAAALARLDPAPVAGDISLPGTLRLSRDGPYLVTDAVELTDHLGVAVEHAAVVALCRCGRSATKPFCDGSHVESGFSSDKDPRRVPDNRDIYVGQQVTVFDNRGLCAHSGFCTDRLNTVFHLGEDPFVTPSGGRLDDIVRAVRRCPSGALGFGFDRNEDREYVDQSRPIKVEISKDGPYRITGGLSLLGETGAPVPRPDGASLEHYSLCRCGSSLNKPFCSGMHWSVSFTDPSPDPEAEPTLFEWAGGYPALLETTRLFYSRHVPADPIVGPLFATMAPDHPERVAAWLSEVFGGPKFYSEQYGGYARMISQHLDKQLTREQRSHWARLMLASADEAGLPDDAEFRAAFTGYIEWGSRIAVENSQTNAKPPPNMPVPQWWWVCNVLPGSRPRAVAAADDPSETLTPPGPDEQASFASHVRPLFRASDRASMRFAFDLWSFDDVNAHADAILARVRAGTMPCDKAWAPEKVALFARWIEDGKHG